MSTETTAPAPAPNPEPSIEDVLSEIKTVETTSNPISYKAEEQISNEEALGLISTKEEAPKKEAPPKPEVQAAQPETKKKYETYLQEVVKAKRQLLNEKQRHKESVQSNARLIEQGKQFEHLMRLKQENPLKFIEEVRLAPDTVVKAIVAEAESERALTPEEKEQRLLQKVEKQVEERILSAEQKRNQEAKERHNQIYIQETIRDYQQTIEKTVADSGNEFEIIRTFQQQPQVWAETLKFYQKYGEVPPANVVCQVVEEKLRADLEQLKETTYFREKLATQGISKANNSKDTSRQSVTLTNSVGKGSSEIITDDLDEKQALEEALKVIQFRS